MNPRLVTAGKGQSTATMGYFFVRAEKPWASSLRRTRVLNTILELYLPIYRDNERNINHFLFEYRCTGYHQAQGSSPVSSLLLLPHIKYISTYTHKGATIVPICQYFSLN